MGVYISNFRLPSEYQEVEYVQSDGNQIIDTGVYGNGNTSILTKMVVSGRKGNYDIYYGAYYDGGAGALFMQYNYPDNNKIRVINYSNDAATKKYVDSINNLQFNTEYIIEHTNTKFLINGTLQGTMASSSFTTPHTLCVFGFHAKNGGLNPVLIGKVYYFKIYESGTLVRDFVPCYRKSDNVIGLYDLVNNQFYTNSGTGTFTKGSDVNTYRESSLKNAYIGEYRVPGANTIAYYPLTANANDYSGNGLNATNYEGTFSETNGGYFGTIVSRLELPSMTIGQTFTISAWIKLPDGQPTGDQEFDIYYDWSASYRNILFSCTAGGITCSTGNNSTTHHAKTVSATFGTGWNNIILTKTGTSYSIYKNGNLLETFSSSYNVSIPGGSNPIYIGHTAASSSRYSAFGYIRDYIVETVARTDQDRTDYYNNTKSNYGL